MELKDEIIKQYKLDDLYTPADAEINLLNVDYAISFLRDVIETKDKSEKMDLIAFDFVPVIWT